MFQLGDCAISDTMRIELGDYYAAHKKAIDIAVKEESKRDSGGPEELHRFGKALRCKKEGLPIFSELLFKNKDTIFGENFDRSARSVTLMIQEKIQDDSHLKDLCK